MPVTTPDVLIDAMPGALLLQVPPVAASVSVVVEPAHSLAVPVIGATAGPASVVHVTELAAVQPAMLVTLYSIVVVPVATAVTVPVLLTVATVGSILPHTPPGVASLSVDVVPEHVCAVPVIAATVGNGTTVLGTDSVMLQPDKPVYI